MKYLWINSLLFSPLMITVSSIVGIPLNTDKVYSQAVDLIEINSGNQTLDSGLPQFYDCIDEKVDSSKGVEEDTYFEKEPTKNEVKSCYNEVLLGSAQSNDGADAKEDIEFGGE
ncbi:MAG: hypothetical protein M3Q77_05835 [Thermoproteota archaeon]|nr:hypothetical protein [Thermoproteota archaeon]